MQDRRHLRDHQRKSNNTGANKTMSRKAAAISPENLASVSNSGANSSHVIASKFDSTEAKTSQGEAAMRLPAPLVTSKQRQEKMTKKQKKMLLLEGTVPKFDDMI